MKTTIAALLLLTAAACTQKTETQTTVDTAGTLQTKTTTVSMPAIDTATTAAVKQDAKEAVADVKSAARDAAHATGTALETAGKKIQEKTSKH